MANFWKNDVQLNIFKLVSLLFIKLLKFLKEKAPGKERRTHGHHSGGFFFFSVLIIV
jgi:hypothetical protein